MSTRVNFNEDFDAGKREELLRLSQRGKIFKLMIEKSEPNEWAEWFRTPLEHACEAGDSDLVDALLEAGADGSDPGLGRRGRTLLHAAAAGGSESVIWSLLDNGARPNIEARLSEEEWLTPDTPLQVAVRHGHAAAAKVLIAAGADMARTMVLAVAHGHDRLACDLLLAGADPGEPGFDGWVMMNACRYGYERLVRALLLQNEGEVSECSMGYTPLHEVARGGHTSIAKVLVAAGLEVDAYTWQGETPLHKAAEQGSAATVGVLIAAGADAGARHPTLGRGRSPLHFAAEKGHTAAALALLRRRGADVNAAENSGLRPLHLACKRNQADMVDLLLKRGADETAVDRDGRTPLDLLPSVESVMRDVDVLGSGRTQEDRGRREAHKRRKLDNRDRAIKLLTRAPSDRAWRRRGVTVLCRARAETLRLRAAAENPTTGGGGRMVADNEYRNKLARRENAGAGGVRRRAALGEGGAGDDGGGVGTQSLGGWLVELQEEGVFRNIVRFL
eukprot:g9463.t1